MVRRCPGRSLRADRGFFCCPLACLPSVSILCYGVPKERSVQPCPNDSSTRSSYPGLAIINCGKKSIMWHRTDAISSPIQKAISSGWPDCHHSAFVARRVISPLVRRKESEGEPTGLRIAVRAGNLASILARLTNSHLPIWRIQPVPYQCYVVHNQRRRQHARNQCSVPCS